MTLAAKGIGGHQSANMRSEEWLTPPEIIQQLGPFDLDPCSPEHRPWPTAAKHYTKQDNGLVLPWNGRVWLNPPYGKQIVSWMKRMSEHNDGIALIFARTDTAFFQDYVFETADSILFVKRRLYFHNTSGMRSKMDCGGPSAFIGYGEKNTIALSDSNIRGKLVLINAAPIVIVGFSPSWKSIVTIALTRLKGEAALKTIYELVEQIAPDKLERNNHYKEKVRQILQVHFTRVRKGHYAA